MTPAEKVAAKKKPRKPRSKGNPSRPRKWRCALREMRESLGLTIRDVAEATGFTGSTLYEIEHGTDPQLTTAVALSEFFGKPVSELWPERV